MSLFCCNNEIQCARLSIVASVIIGIIAAFLSFMGTITVTPIFLWVLFGIAIVYLAITLLVSASANRQDGRRCICANLPTLLTGILGTILTSVILLGITVGTILGAIIVGLLLAFFALTVLSFSCFSYCIARCRDNSEE